MNVHGNGSLQRTVQITSDQLLHQPSQVVLSVDERKRFAGVILSTFRTDGTVASQIFRRIQFATNDVLISVLRSRDASVLVAIQKHHASGYAKQQTKSVSNQPNLIQLVK